MSSRIIYLFGGEEGKLSRREIRNGIMEFENNAHFVDNVEVSKGIIRKITGKLKGISPVCYVSNWWNNKLEPVYILGFKNIFPAIKLAKSEPIFLSEERYNMNPELFKEMLSLKLDKNLLNSEPFHINKKQILIVAVVIVIAALAIYYFTGGKFG